jgi:methyl-accepting chemotaxis protein
MLSWFAKTAPIRTKFDVLTLVYGGIAAIGLGATIAASGGLTLTAPVIAAALALLAAIVVTRVSRKLICDPYVGSVIAMEALAAGEADREILYTDYQDCIGRIAKAIHVFQRNAKDVRNAAQAQQIVVTALGKGLGELAAGNLTETIPTPFPAEYEKLRSDFNRAMESMGRAMSAVSVATHGINAGASDIRQASDDLSQRTEQQAAAWRKPPPRWTRSPRPSARPPRAPTAPTTPSPMPGSKPSSRARSYAARSTPWPGSNARRAKSPRSSA